jgi:mannose-6-phosphate isomerase-like protein (cupin superfamily)
MQEQVRRFNASAEYYTEERCFINEISNIADDPVVSIAQARVQPGCTTRLHRLQGITERYVILSGTGNVEVGNLQAQPVGPGDVVLIPPGCPQRITNTGIGDLLFLAVCSPRFQQSAYEDIDQDLAF